MSLYPALISNPWLCGRITSFPTIPKIMKNKQKYNKMFANTRVTQAVFQSYCSTHYFEVGKLFQLNFQIILHHSNLSLQFFFAILFIYSFCSNGLTKEKIVRSLMHVKHLNKGRWFSQSISRILSGAHLQITSIISQREHCSVVFFTGDVIQTWFLMFL